jgi:hypothetical protein
MGRAIGKRPHFGASLAWAMLCILAWQILDIGVEMMEFGFSQKHIIRSYETCLWKAVILMLLPSAEPNHYE